VDSEVGRLRSVLLHRPGPELARLTPRNNDLLLFDGIPWVGRAQEEHDVFAARLRERGVEVLYLHDLLVETLELDAAREDVTAAVLADARLGEGLRARLSAYLDKLAPAELTDVLTGGLSRDELDRGGPVAGPGADAASLTYLLMPPGAFVVDPLPNLMFTRDSAVRVGTQVALAVPATPARARESTLVGAVWTHHPRFAGTPVLYAPGLEPLEGGDVLLLAPGVLAVGIGERTSAAGAERLARRAFAGGLARTVLAVPIRQQRATMHLDTVVTMVDVNAVVMYPEAADHLVAYVLTPGPAGKGLDVTGPRPFLAAAAHAMGVDELRHLDTGIDPVTSEREQWDDGNNTLALAPRVAVAYERNVITNARLEDAGIEVIRVPGSELGSGRGGPRCLSCPLERDPI
jgi:arginine deiminase